MQRAEVLRRIAERLVRQQPGHPLRVGVDGVCGAGKTTFARDLAATLAPCGRPVVHVDSDGFHQVRAIRYRRGRASARGYYEDAYDFEALRDLVLRPLGAGGSGRYATHVHDLATDVRAPRFAAAPEDAVVLFAATFLQRGALREEWDEVIWLDVPETIATDRGVARDASALGSEAAARAAYADRYMAACRLYVAEEFPRERASIVVEHADPRHPVLARW